VTQSCLESRLHLARKKGGVRRFRRRLVTEPKTQLPIVIYAAITFAVVVTTLLTSNAAGATIYARSCNSSEVQAAINAADEGDTIIMPAGSAAWTQPVTILNKAITLKGAGEGVTVLTHSIPGKAIPMIYIDNLHSKFVRITNFSIGGGAVGNTRDGLIRVGKTFQGTGPISVNTKWRIDHVSFSLTGRGVVTKGRSYGVIDHCSFDAPMKGNQQGVAVFGDDEKSWNRALSLGTTECVCVEDCTFVWHVWSADSAIDAYAGARYTFRHNTLTNIGPGCHGLDSGRYRSPVSWEVYDNKCYNDGKVSQARAIGQFRGGTGVIYNNTCERGNELRPTAWIDVECYRATHGINWNRKNPAGLPWGNITGTNPYDGNKDKFGYPALDQIGAAPPTTPDNITGVSGPPRTGHSIQAHQAAHQWNNKMIDANKTVSPMLWRINAHFNKTTNTPEMHPNVFDIIKNPRDVVDGRPMPGYKPLAYPHPLTSDSGSR
jgi:hypothetical protein